VALVIDNAGWHTAKELIIPSQVLTKQPH